MSENDFYNLGKRDLACELFASFRLKGIGDSLIELAEQIKDNPHAQYYLKNLPKEIKYDPS